MSEYQYYEFLAIDRPLTDRQMRELRSVSSRAEITPTRFTNFYTFGDFKGRPDRFMERYFDAFLYFANWGSRHLMLRLPASTLSVKTAKLYLGGGYRASARAHDKSVILSFRSDDDEGDWATDGAGLLSSIVPVRSALMAGDHRALYLGWLLRAQAAELDAIDEDVKEPPCPPGLGQMPAPLKAFADFIRVDKAVLEVASERSAPLSPPPSKRELLKRVRALPAAEKDALLQRVATGQELAVRSELARLLQQGSQPGRRKPERSRTAGEILEAAGRRRESHKAEDRGSGGDGGRRSTAAIEQLTEQLYAEIRRQPGRRIEEIGRMLDVETRELVLPVKRTKGERRATTYHRG